MKPLIDPKIILKQIREEYALLQANTSTFSIPLWEYHCRKLHNLEWFYVVNFEKRFNTT